MADREKVIEALHCRAYDDDFPCFMCAYYRQDEKPVARCDYRGLMDDAIALLKEQDAVEPKVIRMNVFGYPVHACGKCGHSITESMNYCSRCGTAVKWT